MSSTVFILQTGNVPWITNLVVIVVVVVAPSHIKVAMYAVTYPFYHQTSLPSSK